MDRLITVTGKGRVKCKPDYIRIIMKLESCDRDYDMAMEKARGRIESLVTALSGAGFAKDDPKTSDFSVRAESDTKRSMGRTKEVVTGFTVNQRVRLEFDLDLVRLSKTLAVIAKWSKSEPDLSVNFTVKDPAAVRDALLESAAKNARRQADALCTASGVTLGNLVRVDYSWTEVNFRSSTNYRPYVNSKSVTMLDMNDMPDPSYAMMQPDDIDVQDSATFVWEMV